MIARIEIGITTNSVFVQDSKIEFQFCDQVLIDFIPLPTTRNLFYAWDLSFSLSMVRASGVF